MAPIAAPQKLPLCRRNGLGEGGRRLWARKWTRVPNSRFTTREVLPQRGHGLRSQLPHQTRLPAAAGSMIAPMASTSARACREQSTERYSSRSRSGANAAEGSAAPLRLSLAGVGHNHLSGAAAERVAHHGERSIRVERFRPTSEKPLSPPSSALRARLFDRASALL